MLSSLTIRNVVLIDRLDLEGGSGLCALTGETGAGKSILLDALGLALGARAEAGLVRHGEEQAAVTATFDLPAKHPLIKILGEKGINTAEGLILRRTVSKDGRSRAFINDEPVSVQLLKETGSALIEIHSQFETQGLLDPATHRAALDNYAAITSIVDDTRKAWAGWQDAKSTLAQALSDIETLRLQEEYLTHAVAELEKLGPQPGEEEVLAEKRAFLMNFEKMHDAFEQAGEILESEEGIQTLLGRLQSLFSRLGGKADRLMEPLARAQAEIEDVSYQLESLKAEGNGSGGNLAETEERYFALKDCARKHRCTVDDLPALLHDLPLKLKLATHQDEALSDLRKAVKTAQEKYTALAEKISAAREKSAGKLSKSVEAELPDLKLDKAKFRAECVRMEEPSWGPEGFDRVQFIVSTNPQTPPGPLHKIASGGELARFMLALKVVMAATGAAPTLVFDEVDSGIGGAAADAVGERLAKLAKKYQVLVVTHSPQVAARARHHWHVAKTAQKGAVFTRITPLATQKDRQEEIARMLSGATITKEARAQAARLLEQQDAA
jgi:DNA repair protein RecN (Recombination protein N)